jgi:predicted transcriptional regulator
MATQTSTRLKEEFDDKCKDIVLYMLMRNVFESDKLRYNELYREVKQTFKMSKPTFNEHIQHLIAKKLVTRKESGKQVVYLYLNHNNLMVKTAKDLKEEMKREAAILQAMEKPRFWADAPTFMAYYFALCALRRVKFVIKYYLKPKKAKENLLAASIQAKIEDRLMHDLLLPIDHAKSMAEKERIAQQIIASLDKAIEETKTSMAKFSKRREMS